MSPDNPFSSVCFINHCHYLMFFSVLFLICSFAVVPVIMAQEGPLPSGNNAEPSVFIRAVLLKLQNSAAMALSQIRQKVIQSFIVFFVVFLLLWISAFLYGSLYYSYMPNAAFSTAVHYYYRLVLQVLSSCTRKTQTEVSVCVTFYPIFYILSRVVLQNRL